MKRTTYSLLLLCFFSISTILISQEAKPGFDRIYGLDQTLCNGKRYTYLPPPGSGGHQYLQSQFFYSGSVTLKGTYYRDIPLNYDILNQKLLLQYADDEHPFNIIEISKAWLTGYSLGDKNFEVLNTGSDTSFYQVLGNGPFRILYSWRKNINLNEAPGKYNFVFTSAIRDSYVRMDGKLQPFNSNRNFIKLFAPGLKPEIKSYLRKHKIKVKKASDQSMDALITFIGNLK